MGKGASPAEAMTPEAGDPCARPDAAREGLAFPFGHGPSG